jgi:glucose/arabinose dehydrogenase
MLKQLGHSFFSPLAIAMVLVGAVPAARAASIDLLVASRLTNNVLRYDGVTGAFLGEFVTAGSGGLETPDDVIFGPDGNLYVGVGLLPNGTSGTNNHVIRYDGTTGAFVDNFTATQPSGIGQITFGPDGNLYGTVTTTNVVFRANGRPGHSSITSWAQREV